ncbi:MAG: DUF4156 domain-containing protein [Proteobacteria bacterium]|nr:DUF4156 domain-containing protein [Pseudomonadota bacterium]
MILKEKVMIRHLVMLLLVAASASCTWVKPTEEGLEIMMRDQAEVADCTRVGKTTAMSRVKVAGVKRKEKKVMLELETIARNQAVKMGGNVISPLGPIEGNERSFGVYRCE